MDCRLLFISISWECHGVFGLFRFLIPMVIAEASVVAGRGAARSRTTPQTWKLSRPNPAIRLPSGDQLAHLIPGR
jgi:hypothetical protein